MFNENNLFKVKDFMHHKTIQRIPFFVFSVFLFFCAVLPVTSYAADSYTAICDMLAVCHDGLKAERLPGFCSFAPCPDTGIVKKGTRHPLVLETQRLLNQTTCQVASFGPGSPGQETDYFGSKTHNALQCYSSLGPLYFGVITEHLIEGLQVYVKNTQFSDADCIGEYCVHKPKPTITIPPGVTDPTACTEEAMLCPDGTAVGRTGPNCTFAPCPDGRICLTRSNQCSTCTRSDSSSAWDCVSFPRSRYSTPCDENEELVCTRWSDVGTPPRITAFSPADGSTITDRTQNITITFSEPIKRNARGADFTRADLSRFLNLSTSTNSVVRDIPYTPSISADKTVITLNPAGDLPVGKISVHVPGGYYDADGNRVASARGVTFAVLGTSTPSPDVAPPRITAFSPTDGSTITDRTQNITITFSEPIKRNARGADFTRSDLSRFLDFYTNNRQDIPYNASINAEKTVITLNPVGDLPGGWLYVRVGMRGPYYYYDADGNLGTGATMRFGVFDDLSGSKVCVGC